MNTSSNRDDDDFNVVFWGGLVLSILHLMKNPEELDDVLEEVGPTYVVIYWMRK